MGDNKSINSNLEDALVQKRRDLEADLFNGSSYYDMGLVYEAQGKYNLAYLCFENAIQYEDSEEEKLKIITKLGELESKELVTVRKFSIVILTYNNLEYTKKCIDSIKKYNKLDNYEIVIVDNGSSDETVEWLKSRSDIKYLLNSSNEGFPKGCNQGIGIAEKGNDIMLLNNDTLIMPNSIFNLRMGLYSKEKIGICGSTSNTVSYWQMIDQSFNTEEEYYDYAVKNNIPDSNRHDYRLKLIGFAVLIKREALDEAGLLDERFTPGNFEDDDISLRIIKKGYKNLLCKDSFIFHYGSKSFSKDINNYGNLLEVNSKKFKDKWNINPYIHLTIRFELIGLINEDKYKKFNVLEVGCGCGCNILEMRNRYPNANIFGIESNKSCFEVSKNIEEVKFKNFNEDDFGYEDGFFDYIILNNVLEKVYNPLKLLKLIGRYLKKNGFIIAAISNVMNIKVINQLINGTWTYGEGGVANVDSIRFFTINEIVKLLTIENYSNYNFSASYIRASDEENRIVDEIAKLSKMPTINRDIRIYEYFVKASRQ